jgi:peptide/nickel transport system permease protein
MSAMKSPRQNNLTDRGLLAAEELPPVERPLVRMLSLLWQDKLALGAAIYLLALVFIAIFGPSLFGDIAGKMNLRLRNFAPFSFEQGWMFVLGGDALGRPILARLAVASQNTLAIAGAAVPLALIVGGTLGLIAGYVGRLVGEVIMRLADVLMSFPSLLLAVVVLYVLEPAVANLILVLAITRIPVYIRTTRSEVLEIRERLFVDAARALGAGGMRIAWRHVAPIAASTLITIATIDFAYVMLAESALSFLGIGIQPPESTWGLMVAQGRNYLSSAWWLAFWPGLMIMTTTLALNLLSSWARMATDPVQRWRIEHPRKTAVTSGDTHA